MPATPITAPALLYNGALLNGPSSDGVAYQSLINAGSSSTSFATTLPPWYVEGLIFSNNGSDADHDLDNTAGWLVSDDSAFADRVLFEVPALTKRFDASFSAGTGNGGMKTGTSLSNNTWYRIWGVWGPGVTGDLVMDAGNNPPALADDLAAYTKIAPAFDVYTDGSANIRPFAHTVGGVKWISASVVGGITILDTTSPATTPTALRAATPARSVIASFQQYMRTTSGTNLVCRMATYSTSPEEVAMARVTATNTFYDSSAILETNSSGNIYYKTETATYSHFYIGCPAWSYIRGRE